METKPREKAVTVEMELFYEVIPTGKLAVYQRGGNEYIVRNVSGSIEHRSGPNGELDLLYPIALVERMSGTIADEIRKVVEAEQNRYCPGAEVHFEAKPFDIDKENGIEGTLEAKV